MGFVVHGLKGRRAHAAPLSFFLLVEHTNMESGMTEILLSDIPSSNKSQKIIKPKSTNNALKIAEHIKHAVALRAKHQQQQQQQKKYQEEEKQTNEASFRSILPASVDIPPIIKPAAAAAGQHSRPLQSNASNSSFVRGYFGSSASKLKPQNKTPSDAPKRREVAAQTTEDSVFSSEMLFNVPVPVDDISAVAHNNGEFEAHFDNWCRGAGGVFAIKLVGYAEQFDNRSICREERKKQPLTLIIPKFAVVDPVTNEPYERKTLLEKKKDLFLRHIRTRIFILKTRDNRFISMSAFDVASIHAQLDRLIELCPYVGGGDSVPYTNNSSPLVAATVNRGIQTTTTATELPVQNSSQIFAAESRQGTLKENISNGANVSAMPVYKQSVLPFMGLADFDEFLLEERPAALRKRKGDVLKRKKNKKTNKSKKKKAEIESDSNSSDSEIDEEEEKDHQQQEAAEEAMAEPPSVTDEKEADAYDYRTVSQQIGVPLSKLAFLKDGKSAKRTARMSESAMLEHEHNEWTRVYRCILEDPLTTFYKTKAEIGGKTLLNSIKTSVAVLPKAMVYALRIFLECVTGFYSLDQPHNIANMEQLGTWVEFIIKGFMSNECAVAILNEASEERNENPWLETMPAGHAMRTKGALKRLMQRAMENTLRLYLLWRYDYLPLMLRGALVLTDCFAHPTHFRFDTYTLDDTWNLDQRNRIFRTTRSRKMYQPLSMRAGEMLLHYLLSSYFVDKLEEKAYSVNEIVDLQMTIFKAQQQQQQQITLNAHQHQLYNLFHELTPANKSRIQTSQVPFSASWVVTKREKRELSHFRGRYISIAPPSPAAFVKMGLLEFIKTIKQQVPLVYHCERLRNTILGRTASSASRNKQNMNATIIPVFTNLFSKHFEIIPKCEVDRMPTEELYRHMELREAMIVVYEYIMINSNSSKQQKDSNNKAAKDQAQENVEDEDTTAVAAVDDDIHELSKLLCPVLNSTKIGIFPALQELRKSIIALPQFHNRTTYPVTNRAFRFRFVAGSLMKAWWEALPEADRANMCKMRRMMTVTKNQKQKRPAPDEASGTVVADQQDEPGAVAAETEDSHIPQGE